MNLSEEKQTELYIQVMKEIIDETKQKCVSLSLDLSHSPSIFESKFAGTGYVPHDEKIPVDSKNRQLRLLAQIECEKVKIENFPSKGLLQFWAYDDDLTGADFDEPTNQNGFRIIYHETVDKTVTEEEILAKTLPFEDESFFPIEKEVALKLVETTNSLSFGDYRFDLFFAEKFNKLSPDETIESMCDLDIDPWDIEEPICKKHIEESGWGHKIGGFPAFTQTDPREGCIDNPDSFDTLLLQIDSDEIDDEHEILWGDCGICNFFINSEKLKKCDFSEVVYNWDCC